MGTEKQGTRDREPAGLVCRSHGLTVRSLDSEKRSIEVIASSESLDSHDEIVEQTWDFGRFKQNPVILWAHNKAPGHDGKPIGRGEDWRVEQTKDGPQMRMRIVFAKHSFAEEIWQLFQDDMLRAVSVGFRPREVRLEKHKGEEVFVLSNNELFELSVVPIGSNPDALAKSIDGLLETKAALRAATHQIQPAPIAEETIKTMSEADTEKALRTSLDEVRLEKSVADGRVKELEKSLTTVTTERDAAVQLASKHEAKLIELQVDALVGKKINPAQREKFIKLRGVQGEKDFAEFVADMPELPTMKSVTGEDKDTANTATKSTAAPRALSARLSKVGS